MSALCRSPLLERGNLKFDSWISHIIFTDGLRAFIELKVADDFTQRDTTLTAADIAARHGWNAQRLYRLLRHLAFAGIVSASDGGVSGDRPETRQLWQLTDEGRLLQTSHPSQLHALFAWDFTPIMRASAADTAAIIAQPDDDYTAGTAAYIQRENGGKPEDVFAFLHRDGYASQGAAFDSAMSAYAAMESAALLRSYDAQLRQCHSVVDLGGNLGSLMCYFAAAHPQLQAINADLPPVIAAAKQRNEAAAFGLQPERVRHVCMDLFQPESVQAAVQQVPAIAAGQPWLMTCKHVLHDWSDADVVTILSNVRTAVRAVPDAARGLTLAILEFVYMEADSGSNWLTSAYDIRMMYLVHGRQRGETDWQQLLERAGWKRKSIIPCSGSALSILEAVLD